MLCRGQHRAMGRFAAKTAARMGNKKNFMWDLSPRPIEALDPDMVWEVANNFFLSLLLRAQQHLPSLTDPLISHNEAQG